MTTTPAPVPVLVTLGFPDSFLDAVRAVDPRIVVHHHPVPDDGDVTGVVPADVLASAEVMYTSALLPGPQEAPALRWAQLDTSGVDHCRGTGLWEGPATITTLGGVSPAPLAEWIIMVVLAHAHRLRETERYAAQRTWPDRATRWSQLMPRNLRTSTLGIVGYGRIGAEVARLARALGMEVVALRRSPAPDATAPRFNSAASVPDVEVLSPHQLPELLRRSDYVALTVPLTPETQGMIGATELAVMKPGSVLVNGSRGGVVDEDALLDALDDGPLDMVASDVFAQEPLPTDHPLWNHPQSMVTPHVAGFAPDYLEAVTALFTENLRRHLDGAPLLNVADRERGY
ncbi:D-2-hydroxyacid dehydrogenase [Pedococcus aerophilus]|uniref:D-2-hydroxyacid dehydrogenase n=1 Tax=Pedococcus aerophilus TaxID=436356 RepID=A0ABN3UWF6_9MICO